MWPPWVHRFPQAGVPFEMVCLLKGCPLKSTTLALSVCRGILWPRTPPGPSLHRSCVCCYEVAQRSPEVARGPSTEPSPFPPSSRWSSSCSSPQHAQSSPQLFPERSPEILPDLSPPRSSRGSLQREPWHVVPSLLFSPPTLIPNTGTRTICDNIFPLLVQISRKLHQEFSS